MGFYIKLEEITLEDYKENLRTGYLLPSRQLLKDNIDDNFNRLKKQDLTNLSDIIEALKTKNKITDFADQSGITETYLTILNRELKSYRQPPVKLKDFPGISEETVLKLEAIKLDNTLKLFDKVLTPLQRSDLATQTGIDTSIILKLTKLTDLSRIRWVASAFANVLYEAKYDTTHKVAKANYEQLYEDIKSINNRLKLYKGQIGKNDMKLCVKAAQDVALDIEY